MNNKLLLIVLDGWGVSNNKKGNAILQAHANNFEKLKKENIYTELNASEKFVGLLPGFIGNSEVGHLHIGAGRLVKQDLVRIFDSIKDKSFFKNKVLLQAINDANKRNGSLHLLGLISDAGVHSHIEQLFALLDMAKMYKAKQVYVHAITDGRDVEPKSALKYIKQIENKLKSCNKNWKIATVIGRYYAMDRDNRWNREHKAYDAMVNCKGHHHNGAETAIIEAYKRGETDEFVYPTVVGGKTCNVKSGDSVIFFNFRSDRARELTRAFVQGRFNKFKTKKLVPLNFVCLTQYDPDIKAPVAFEPLCLCNTLGEAISRHGLKQFRLAETEKWAHVTYFFNGLSGVIFENESRLLIPSPKITTYDKKPEMSAYKIKEKLLDVLDKKEYDFILVNFANPDMVGHTGQIQKTIKAIKTVDKCLGEIVNGAKQNNYDIMITADHGNAEEMQGKHITSHTTNKVPFILISNKKLKLRKIKDAALYNVAPTILKLMNIEKPEEMTQGLV